MSMTNADRAWRAEEALRAYVRETGALTANDLETWFSDLLCDLRHFASAMGVEFNPDAGEMNYQAECEEDEPGDFSPQFEWVVGE